MLRCGKKTKSFVVVEGVTDYRVYGKLLDKKSCEIVIGENKENVIEAIRMCEEQRLEGIIGIVDADFWHAQTKIPHLPKTLFVTDYHDLECMMLHSKAFDDVFLEYGDEGKLAHYERKIQEKLVQWMLENVARIGYLRKLSLEKNMELRFSELHMERFINPETLKIQEEKMIQEILFASHKHTHYKLESIKKRLQESINPYDDLWQICCGHDLMEWLCIAFINKLGNYNSKKLFSGQLEGSFRMCYHKALFEQTQLYEELKNWESHNEPFKLFEPTSVSESIA